MQEEFQLVETLVQKVDTTGVDPIVVREAAEILLGGGLVALPTETVYGVAANALDELAVRRIFLAKERPAANPVIVHAADARQAQTLVDDWPVLADRLADVFWPGPLTLVLHRGGLVPGVVSAGGPTVAVRVPNHAVFQAVIRAAGIPLAAPSANRSQQLSPTTAEHVLRDLEGRIELVLDAGPTPGGIESTVVDLTDKPSILRPGPITQSMLEQALGVECPLAKPPSDLNAPLRSPGSLARHYAPRTPLECSTAAPLRVAELSSQNKRIGWLTLGEESDANYSENVIVLSLPSNPTAYGRGLYAELHRLDELGLDRIVVSLPPDQEEWAAIRDRLIRGSNS